MKIEGGCHCGSITYEAEIDPEGVVVCHCTDCQALSGSAFRTVVFSLEDAFRLLSGEPKIYIKTAASGAKREQAFCPECGSPIYATSPGEGPKVHGIRLGTVRQRAELPPRKQVWHRSAHNSPLKKALLTGFHSTAKHNATKAVSPSSETMRTI